MNSIDQLPIGEELNELEKECKLTTNELFSFFELEKEFKLSTGECITLKLLYENDKRCSENESDNWFYITEDEVYICAFCGKRHDDVSYFRDEVIENYKEDLNKIKAADRYVYESIIEDINVLVPCEWTIEEIKEYMNDELKELIVKKKKIYC